ncbi:hypothetical protein DE146DRAFT_679082 [Phaeosphaeria sp. MPI-PUGE-AT-0046c]|nr:hypothetical protein DE146DRAFT_679082 [Phaeosphaeria sp. MPI-PUGE-AT-0046c]
MAASMSSEAPDHKINRAKFYFEYKGHPLSDLATFLDITRAERPGKPIVYLAGDSSLDNKFWLHKSIEDINPIPKPDVSFWLNHLLGERATCINTAVEESMIRERSQQLISHDEFIRDNMTSDDVLIVSVGGNDVAFKPNACTIFNMLRLAWLTPRRNLENGTASALGYFKNMFCDQVQEYVAKMTAKTKPRAVIVCMIYYPLEAQHGQSSWSDKQLTALRYDSDPGQLQAAIRAMYRIATCEIRVEGTRIVPCALYDVMDGKSGDDYTERVEPNEEGGRKMAMRFMESLDEVLGLETSSTEKQV